MLDYENSIFTDEEWNELRSDNEGSSKLRPPICYSHVFGDTGLSVGYCKTCSAKAYKVFGEWELVKEVQNEK